MVIRLIGLIERTVESTAVSLTEGFVAAIPRLTSAIVIVLVAYIVIKLVTALVRAGLSRVYPADEALVTDLVVIMVSVALWFGVALTLLKVLGLDEIAASIGTAVGFIALGVAYALSEMIEDTVSGVYLLRDPDFNPGDRVETETMTGEVRSIGLRKSRFTTDDGDIAVLANRNVESRWTRHLAEAA